MDVLGKIVGICGRLFNNLLISDFEAACSQYIYTKFAHAKQTNQLPSHTTTGLYLGQFIYFNETRYVCN